MSDKIQYNVPLPGEEFRARNLSVPIEAAKVLFEIDFQHGQDRELCLSVLARVFRGVDDVTQILRESGKVFQKENAIPWRREAGVQRSLKASIWEQEMKSESNLIKEMEKEVMILRGRERGESEAFEMAEEEKMSVQREGREEEEGTGEEREVARNLSRSDFTPQGLGGPPQGLTGFGPPPGTVLFGGPPPNFGGNLKRTRGNILALQALILKAKANFARVARELADEVRPQQ